MMAITQHTHVHIHYLCDRCTVEHRKESFSGTCCLQTRDVSNLSHLYVDRSEPHGRHYFLLITESLMSSNNHSIIGQIRHIDSAQLLFCPDHIGKGKCELVSQQLRTWVTSSSCEGEKTQTKLAIYTIVPISLKN